MKIKNSYIFKDVDVARLTVDDTLASPVFQEVVAEYLDRVVAPSAVGGYLDRSLPADKKVTALANTLRALSENSLKLDSIPLADRSLLLAVIDGIYDTWRQQIRYLVSEDRRQDPHLLIDCINDFSSTIIRAYRRLYEKVNGGDQRVYRELASGVNGGLLLGDTAIILPPELDFLKEVRPISSLVIKPPFMVQTACNKRSGIFLEGTRPLRAQEVDAQRFFLLPIKIRDQLALCYVHASFLSALMGLGTLFEIADKEYLDSHRPSMVMVYGADVDSDPYYYKQGEIYIGVIPLRATMDYFGYAKKMLLTLFNLKMIDQKLLPIHGAGIKVVLSDGSTRNIAILGDSGAGKSETIEALQSLKDPRIAEIVTIFDDMGTFSKVDGEVCMSGTETGAFVRLDDLDKSYSLRSIDRAIFYNPDQTNSRVVIPATTYEVTNSLHRVDLFLYADNYTKSDIGLTLLSDLEEAKAIFTAGRRVAMKTTTEQGLVSTFFANPFGPLQRQAEVRELITDYFKKLYAAKVEVGVLFTGLAIERSLGVQKAGRALLDLICHHR